MYQDYLKPKDYMLERQYTLASEKLHYETEEADVTKYFTMYHNKTAYKKNTITDTLRKKVG